MFSVGIFSYSTKPRGSVVHAACLAEALTRKGVPTTLYALSKSGDEFYRPLACAVRLIPAEPAGTDVEALIRQRIAEFQSGIRTLRRKHDVYHAEDCLAANALAAAKVGDGAACVVRTVHHVERFESPYLRACQARSIASADLLLSVSRVTSRDVRAHFGREAAVISNGVDSPRFEAPDSAAVSALRSRIGADAADTLVLSVGGVEERKNSLGALAAVALAYAQQPSFRWLIAGGASIWEHSAYRAEFARRLAQLPSALQARITLLGTVSEPELTTLYQASSVLLFPSLQEGFGLSVLEALAARSAVIVPHGAPFDEYLDERCASFVDPTSATDVCRALLGLLQSPEQRARLALAGHERVQRYSWDAVAERHLSSYESALGRGEPLPQLSTS